MLRVVRVDVDVPDRKSFHTRLRVLALPNVSIIERRTTPSTVRRTAELTRDGDDALVFTLPWRNSAEVRGAADHGRAGSGEAIVAAMDQATSLHAPNGFRGVSLRLSRSVARNVASGIERRLNQRIPLDPTGSALLRSYLVSLVSSGAELSQSAAELADRHVRELLAHLFDPVGDLARAETYGGLKAARLKGVAELIAERFADPDLSAATLGHGSDCPSATYSSSWRARAFPFPAMSASCG